MKSQFGTTWIDFEGIMLSKMADRERQILYTLKVPITRKKISNCIRLWTLTRLNCRDHFKIYTNIESLCCTPETN